MGQVPPAYPVGFDVEPQLTGRNRLTTLFRIILGFPQIILIGGLGMGRPYRGSGSLSLPPPAISSTIRAWSR
jgi:hypothetical protein